MSLRLFFAILLVVTGVAGGYVFFGQTLADPEGQAEAERLAAHEAEIRDGLIAQVEALDQPKLASTVAGNEVMPKIWDFRGTTQLTEETKGSVYGRMMLHCDHEFSRPDCWTVSYLKVDGRDLINLDEEQRAAAAAQARVALASAEQALKTTQTAAKQTISTPGAAGAPEAGRPVAAMSVAPSAAPEPAPAPAADPMEGAETGDARPAAPQPAEPEAAVENEDAGAVEAVVAAAIAEGDATGGGGAEPVGTVATHYISASEVNARAEPGRNGRIVAILPTGQDLFRIGGDEEWGQYQILGGPEDGEQVWIYNRLVDAKE